jgi:hypothetical protein
VITIKYLAKLLQNLHFRQQSLDIIWILLALPLNQSVKPPHQAILHNLAIASKEFNMSFQNDLRVSN